MKNKKIILAIFIFGIIVNLGEAMAFDGEIVLVASGDGTESIQFPFSDVEKGDLIKANLEGNDTFTYIYGDSNEVANYNEENPSSALIIRKNIIRRSGNIEVEYDCSNWSLRVFAEGQDVLLTYEVEKFKLIPGYSNFILMSTIGITLVFIKRKMKI
jgi:hypothetical protein